MNRPIDPAAAVLRAPAWAPLAELGVITAIGDDAAHFLHGQLTQDIEHLGRDRLRLAGYCTPKGRLLATFRIWHDDGGIHLLLPRELLPGVLKRLSMFVLRAKVKLADASAAWQVQALLGPGAEARLRQAFGDVPAAAGDCSFASALRIARLQPSACVAERFLLICPAADAPSLLAPLDDVARVDATTYWWSEIDAGVPTVFAATQERFVPQMINFEVVGGVDFRKGCYPGQEVVARSQYRGKLKRRMQLAHVDAAVAAGADVFAESAAEAVGTVAMVAAAPEGGFDLLFECPQESVEAVLHAGEPTGPRLALRELPYEIVDVTA